jgi:hypothetical protein
MEILTFGLIAAYCRYRQQRGSIVREPAQFQPFDLRALNHSLRANGRRSIDRQASFMVQVAS